MPVEYNEQMDIDEVLTGDDMAGKISYEAAYALYVNYDTAYADSQPPFEPLHEWVQRNWGDLSAGLKDEAGWEGISREKHQEEVTWLVIRSIQEHGIEGVHFAERSIQHGLQQADDIAEAHQSMPAEDRLRLVAEELIERMYDRSQEIIEDEAKDTGALKESGSYELTGGDG